MNVFSTGTARLVLALSAAALLAGCQPEAPTAVGLLERDRITLPATQSEPIVDLPVKEGDKVLAGTLLVQLDARTQQARVDAAVADLNLRKAVLREAEAGARSETRREAEARVSGAQARSNAANKEQRRVQDLVERKLMAASALDRASAEARSANAELRQARAALDALRNGTRSEQLEQAHAAVTAARAAVTQAEVALDKLSVRAPQDGIIESLPYRLGDQPNPGAPLAILLTGDRPYARIFVPEAQRARMNIGDRLQVTVRGREQGVAGTVRWIASDAAFTPYYALSGQDAARLSYPADVMLDDSAKDLPTGLPVIVHFEANAGDGR
ncbi:MAG: HlyD family efflux transporter periplasmic adaptor subunit [Xanthomonadales bacterium]|nr:HlyD family efflux transporter periplasmic adaptor subunit [Xanthomonadales bacterium]